MDQGKRKSKKIIATLKKNKCARKGPLKPN